MEMLVNRATGLVREPMKDAKRIRDGKTKRDHESGAWKSRFTNRAKPIRRTSSYENNNGLGAPTGGWGG